MKVKCNGHWVRITEIKHIGGLGWSRMLISWDRFDGEVEGVL